MVFLKKYYVNIIVMAFFITMVSFDPSYADAPKLVTGTQSLLSTATLWLTGLIPTGVGLFCGWHAFQKSLTEDQAIITEKNRLIKNTLIGGAIATGASGLVTSILAFYK